MQRTTLLIPLLAFLLSCGHLSELGDEPPMDLAPLPAYRGGEVLLEEKIIGRDIIVSAYFTSVSSDVLLDTETWHEGPGPPPIRYRVVLKFGFDSPTYLKGSGPRNFTAVWLDAYTYETKAKAESARDTINAERDIQWDNEGEVALLFLNHGDGIAGDGTEVDQLLNLSDHFFMGTNFHISPDDGYSLYSNVIMAWHPRAPYDPCPPRRGVCTRVVEYLLELPPTENTITHTEVHQRISKINAELAGGANTEGHRECVIRKYENIRLTENWPEETGGDPYTQWETEHAISSGLPAGTEIDNRHFGNEYPDPAPTWLEGTDSDLFIVSTGPPAPEFSGLEGVEIISTVRPLPAGEYSFDIKESWPVYRPCNYVFSNEIGVTVTAEEALHEFFFDPVTDGDTVAADGTHGVLKPTDFTGYGGTSVSISRLEASTSTATLTVDSTSGLTDLALDIIELDGTISLILDYSDATVDSESNTLNWSVGSQPWSAGDNLMVRIRQQFPPAP